MMFIFIFLVATLGLPAGIIYLIVEMLLNYSKDKATQEKIKKAIPKFQDGWTDKASPSFPDLQRTVGGKMSGSAEQSNAQTKTGTSGKTAASNASQPYSYSYSSNGTQVNSSGSTANRQFNKKEQYARPIKRPRKSKIATAAAVGLFAVSGVSLWAVLIDVFTGISQGSLDILSYANEVPALLISIVCLIAGIWLIYSKKRKYDRENRYIAIINQGYGVIPIDNICYLFPEKYDTCVQELQEMINSGMLPDAYIDYGRRLLVIDPHNSSMEPLIKQNPDAASGAASAAGQGTVEKSKKSGKKKVSEQKIDFLSLERLSKQVKDEDIKMKLIRISTTLKTIGQKAEEDPEIKKAAGVDTFMEMYLPKTIQLVEDYEEVNSMADMPQNNELKQNILDTLDAIDDAAMTLWKDIIHSDMIDISAELDALQTKLVMDGYKKSELEPDAGPSEFTFDGMDISETEEEAEEKRKAEEAKKAEEAAREAEENARKAEAEDAQREADLFSQLRAQQEKEKELLK